MSNTHSDEVEPPKYMDPYESTFGIPINVLTFCVTFSFATFYFGGIYMALLIGVGLLIAAYVFHRDNPMAMYAFIKANDEGYAVGQHDEKKVVFF
jgi:hypothetical protein